jgi:hypothetical protein
MFIHSVAMSFSPLVDVAISFITEGGQPLDPQQLANTQTLLQNYLNDQISFPACLAGVSGIIGGPQAVYKLDGILRTPEAPIPPGSQATSAALKTHPWSPYEDQRLLAGIHRFGLQDWQSISTFVGNGRSKSQCSQRWIRGLDPRISKSQWSDEQDARLLELVATHGEKNWTWISSDLGNRCDVQCRYRFKQLQKQPDFEDKMRIARQSVRCDLPPPKRLSRPPPKPQPQYPAQIPQFAQYPGVYPQFQLINGPAVIPFGPPPPMPNQILGISQLGFQTTMIPPVVQLVAEPVMFAPPKPDEGTIRIPRQTSLGGLDVELPGIPSQASAADWKGALASSDSTSFFFGISPMNSFKFDT